MGADMLTLSIEALHHETKVLMRLRDKLTRTRDHHASLPPADQANTAFLAISELSGSASFANSFVTKQIGDENWDPGRAELNDLPQRARERWLASFSNRVRELWPWLLANDRETASTASTFYRGYKRLAEELDLFPFEPTLANVKNQRLVDWRVRYLVAQIMLVNDCINKPDIVAGPSGILELAARALEVYEAYSIEELQQTVLGKAPKIAGYIPYLIQHNLWDNKTDLMYMCLDRGLREAIVSYYGLMRVIHLPAGSGYKAGQMIMVVNPLVKGCVRVAT